MAQTVGNWVAKWRKEHPDPGTDDITAEEHAEIRRLKAEPWKARMETEHLEESGGLLRPGVRVSVRYRCIHREEGNYPVRSMCRWAKVSKSGYYAWRNWSKSSIAERREDLTAIIVKFFDESEQTYGYRPYGYRRIHAELTRSGIKASRDMVRKIMAAEGLVA